MDLVRGMFLNQEMVLSCCTVDVYEEFIFNFLLLA